MSKRARRHPRLRPQHRRLRVFSVSFALCAPLFASLPVHAQDWCRGMVNDRDSRVVKRLERPAARASYTDPAFGTRVTRVTDAPKGSARRTLYSTVQPWNADESKLVLYHTDPGNSGHHLYDGKTYDYIRPLEFLASDIEEIYWDDTDPSTMYFVLVRPRIDPLFGKLVKYNVDTGKRSLAADLDTICGKAADRGGVTAKGGNDVQGMAAGKIGLRCDNPTVTGRPSDVTFTVDVRTGKISAPVTIDPSQPQGGNDFGFLPNIAASPMHGGQRVLLQGSVFDENMNFLYALDGSLERYRASNGGTYTVPKAEHASIGRLSDGRDALFSSRYDVMQNGCEADADGGQGALVAQDAESGACRVLIGKSTGWNYPLSGVHVSTVSNRNLDWVTMTSIGYGYFEFFGNGRPAPLMFSELTLTKADLEDPTTCRVAHTRSHGKAAVRAGGYGQAYFGEPHAVMSPSGSRLLFNSDWYDSGSVDTYAVDLGTRASGASTTRASAPVRVARAAPNVSSVGGTSAAASVDANTSAIVRSDAVGSDYRLTPRVRIEESPPRVYVDFATAEISAADRVTIAPAGSPDEQWKMWLYTNGTQALRGAGVDTGTLDFLQLYLGSGAFEARLFTGGDLDRAVHRVPFTIP